MAATPLVRYAQNFLAPAPDWPAKLERLRESLSGLKLALDEETHAEPAAPAQALNALFGEGRPGGPLEDIGRTLGWSGALPSAAEADKQRSTLTRLKVLARGGKPAKLEAETRRLKAGGLTWNRARLLQMALFIDAARSVPDPSLRAQLSRAEVIDDESIHSLAAASEDSASVAAVRLTWALTQLLLADGPTRAERYESQVMPRLYEAAKALPPDSVAVRVAFLRYYAPSRDWQERMAKIREIMRVLAPLIKAGGASPIGDKSPIAKYTKLLIRDPASPQGLNDGVISNHDFGGLIGWGSGGKTDARAAYRQAGSLLKMISEHRRGDRGPLETRAAYFDQRNIYMEQTLLWTIAYYHAAVKSIDAEKHPDVVLELGVMTTITDARLAQLRGLAKSGVIRNPTAVGRLHYMWALTKFLMISMSDRPEK